MRFRWLRSKAFWFGVPGLVFLLWAWWISMEYGSYAGFGGLPEWHVAQGGGEVYAAWSSFELPNWGHFHARHYKVPLEYLGNSKANLDSWCRYWTTSGYVLIRYHWLVICYLAVWAAVLVWRMRKFEKRPAA